jgi:hypothetical protein
MKIIGIVGILSAAIVQVQSQLSTREPTHIMKVKGVPEFKSFNGTVARHNFFHHVHTVAFNNQSLEQLLSFLLLASKNLLPV